MPALYWILSALGLFFGSIWTYHFTFGAEHRRPKRFGLSPAELRFLRTNRKLVSLMANSEQVRQKAERVSTYDEAVDFFEEIFDDPEDAEMLIDKLNTFIGLPGISEEQEEKFVIRPVVEFALELYHARISPATQNA